jgi:hypothetical protein
MRFQLAAILAPFAYFAASVAFFGQEAGLAAPLLLDAPDKLGVRGIGDARLESGITSQLLQLLNGHIRLT